MTKATEHISGNQELFHNDPVCDQLYEMIGAYESVKEFGSSPLCLTLLLNKGFLNGTPLDGVGLESFLHDTPDGVETQLTLESLMHNIEEKASDLGAKISTSSSDIIAFVKSKLK